LQNHNFVTVIFDYGSVAEADALLQRLVAQLWRGLPYATCWDFRKNLPP
jgi:hypothetical protein